MKKCIISLKVVKDHETRENTKDNWMLGIKKKYWKKLIQLNTYIELKYFFYDWPFYNLGLVIVIILHYQWIAYNYNKDSFKNKTATS